MISGLSSEDRLGLLITIGGMLFCETLLATRQLPNPTPPILAVIALVAFRFTGRSTSNGQRAGVRLPVDGVFAHHGAEPVDATIRLPVIPTATDPPSPTDKDHA